MTPEQEQEALMVTRSVRAGFLVQDVILCAYRGHMDLAREYVADLLPHEKQQLADAAFEIWMVCTASSDAVKENGERS